MRFMDRWLSTSASDAHRSAPVDKHERGCAALDRSWRQTCPQPVLIAAQTDPQDGEVSAERGMRQFTGHAVT